MSDRVSRYHGFPLLTSEALALSLFDELESKLNRDKGRCQSILNSLDSFPFGLTSKGHDSTVRDGHRGRAMNHPDIVNLQALDGVLFNIKYLVLVRNVTVSISLSHSSHQHLLLSLAKDASISALSRRFLDNVDELLRGVEMNLLYLEASLRAIPCHQIFLAHFEQFHSDPLSFLSPLQSFLQLTSVKREVLKENLLVFQKERNWKRRDGYSFPSSLCGKGFTQYGCYRQV
jgi:hypothetical protein